MTLTRTLAHRLRQQPAARKARGRVPTFEALEERLALHGPGGHDDGPGPHPDDPVLRDEHLAVMNLVRYDAVTHAAVKSGDWDDPATWDHGVPASGANVLIPFGMEVRLDTVQRELLRTIRIDGKLEFEHTVNTGLMVDTVVVDPRGTLEIGTRDEPIAPGVEAKIIIADFDPLRPTDRHWDPLQFSRGLISHGSTEIYGEVTTPFVALRGAAKKGDTQLALGAAVVGWGKGDRLVLTGTNANGKEDEELEIVAIFGNVVTLNKPLAFNHAAPEGMSVYVTNVSRNAVVESGNPYKTEERGHVMFMHNPSAEVNYAGFYGLGRTDKRNPLHNVELDEHGHAVAGTGKNQVGRYAVHFHRAGLGHGGHAAVIQGSVVVDSPGWGFVSHSSNVDMADNVAFDVIGAAFVTEVGNEIGSFRRNLAIKSTGSGDGIESRQDRQDFGHQGDGFWFQGGGVEVEGNIAVGQRHAGFVYFTRALNEKGLGTARFLTEHLADPSIAGGQETIDVGSVPIRLFKDNVAFASGAGFESWFHLLNAKHQARSVLDGFKTWNIRGTAVFTPYTNQTTIRGAVVLGNLASPRGTAFGRNDVTRNIRYENVTAVGFETGISVPVNGHTVIDGGTFSNVRSIVISTANSKDRVVDIQGNVRFDRLSDKALNGRAPYEIYLKSNFNPKEQDITRVFNPDVIRMGTVRYQGKQLYYFEQASDFVPFKAGEAPAYVPKELLGLTNQQMWDRYGLAVGGIVAPRGAVTDPDIHALIGDPATYLPELKLSSAKYSNKLAGYKLAYKDAAGVKVTDPTAVNLREGWNLITRAIGGQVRTFLVYGDVTAPTFQLDSKIDLRINPQDLKAGIFLTGKILDDSFGSMSFKRQFKDLDKLPAQTRADGSKFVALEFTIKDFAGNETQVSLQLTVDPNAPRQMDNGFKSLPPKEVSETLVALLGFKDDRPNG